MHSVGTTKDLRICLIVQMPGFFSRLEQNYNDTSGMVFNQLPLHFPAKAQYTPRHPSIQCAPASPRSKPAILAR